MISPLQEQIQALIAKWRDSAEWEAENRDYQRSAIWDQCANELVSLLSAPAPGETAAEHYSEWRGTSENIILSPRVEGNIAARINESREGAAIIVERLQTTPAHKEGVAKALRGPSSPPVTEPQK